MSFKRKSISSKLILSVFLSLQIGLEPMLAHANAPIMQNRSMQTANDLQKEEDPIWQKFVDTEGAKFNLSFDAKDPAIDRDPFFMKAQSWNQNSKAVSSISFTKSSEAIDIQIPGISKTLKINLALNPIQSTEEFIFFSLDEKSDLFKNAAGLGQVAGEGIFFIHRDDLAQQAQAGMPVPVFFFPLAG